jgi:preprotein translocase subunit SecB
MKAHPSPLKCHGYYVTELALTANPHHKPSETVNLDFADLAIESTTEHVPQDQNGPVWRVALRVHQNVGPDKNSPYNFAIALLGTFEVHPNFPPDKVKQLVDVNGSSILYGAARQILRQAMSSGPFTPLLLPSASFIQPPAAGNTHTVAESKTEYGDKAP